jgi:hypothetical protein
MKRRIDVPAPILILLAGMLIGFASAMTAFYPTPVAAQKASKVAAPVDLDSGIAPLHGKRVFYQLTDEEGGTAEPDGRKTSAIITFNYRGLRDDQGRLVSALIILRPGFRGGLLIKDEVPGDSSRSPGTWDTIQPGDQRN